MRFHSNCPMPEKEMKKLAIEVGLDCIDFKKLYKVSKIGIKNKSTAGYPDAMPIAQKADLFIVGSEGFIWLVFWEGFNWFKTSPIISCKKFKYGYKLETQNSFYKIMEA